MPDLDQYEPLAGKWRSIYKSYVENADSKSEEIADAALRVITAMLRACHGCVLLPQITQLLWKYQPQLIPQSLFSNSAQEALAQFNHQLAVLVQGMTDQRIEMVAVRAAQTVALHMVHQRVAAQDYSTLQQYVGAQVIKDLIRHCFLDKARAFSVGKRFRDGAEAYGFYQHVMSSIEGGMGSLVKQFVERPNGERLRYRSFLKKQSTKAMLHDEGWRMDA